jgi:hypothetical protein
MTDVKVELPGYGFSFEADAAWIMPEAGGAPGVQQDHGVHLEAPSLLVTVNVRSLWDQSCELSAAGVLACLKEQQWGARAFDLVESSNGPVVWAAGTFEMRQHEGAAIREWFITNGERLVNLGLLGTLDAVRHATPSCEAMVRSLQFDSPRT